MKIVPIAAFQDNYIWAINCPNGKSCWVVDPGDAQKVNEYLANQSLVLEGILLTHHHPDHSGGIEALCSQAPVHVYGATHSKIAFISHRVKEGDTLEIFGVPFEVVEIPGHTLDHIAFYSQPLAVLFCGDTLFAGGCGRVFEGTMEQMLSSLEKLNRLPAETKIYCAHEYTLSNLAFAAALERENQHLKQRINHCNDLRAQGLPTVPSTLAEERLTNPFLRSEQPSLLEGLSKATKVDYISKLDAFTATRKLKDVF